MIFYIQFSACLIALKAQHKEAASAAAAQRDRCLMGRKLGATMLGSDSVHNDLLNRVQIINTSNLKIRPLEAEIFSNYVTSMTL